MLTLLKQKTVTMAQGASTADHQSKLTKHAVFSVILIDSVLNHGEDVEREAPVKHHPLDLSFCFLTHSDNNIFVM